MSDEIVGRGVSWCCYCIDLWIDKRAGKTLFAVLVMFIFLFSVSFAMATGHMLLVNCSVIISRVPGGRRNPYITLLKVC